MTEYGNRLKSARAGAGLTQMQLSAITGIRQSTISTAEREGNGSAETTVYAKALAVNAHWLATGEGIAKPKAPEPWVDEMTKLLAVVDPPERAGILAHFRWYIENFSKNSSPIHPDREEVRANTPDFKYIKSNQPTAPLRRKQN